MTVEQNVMLYYFRVQIIFPQSSPAELGDKPVILHKYLNLKRSCDSNVCPAEGRIASCYAGKTAELPPNTKLLGRP
jgi:hypothetical protein